MEKSEKEKMRDIHNGYIDGKIHGLEKELEILKAQRYIINYVLDSREN
jgi:hypothetical protein